jgi:FixJ family two-component response regulator
MAIPPQILVVDVDLSSRSGLIRLLRGAGHDARGFASVAELLDALGPETPACLVLDSETIGPTGEELQAGLEVGGRHIPIIMVTATDDDMARQKARELKAVGLYRKPVDGLALLDAVKWALEVVERR